MSISKKYDVLIISIITFSICFSAYLFLNQKYFFSDFLPEDDNIFAPKAMFSTPDYLETTTVQNFQFFLIDITSIFHSIPIMRMFILLFFSLSAVFISIIFSKHLKGNVLPIFLGIAILTIPIPANQIIFITGSHPTLSLFFMLFSLLLFNNVDKFIKLKFVFYNIIILAMLFMAIFSSPIGFMAPLALPMWLIITRLFINDLGKLSFKEWLLFLCTIIIICTVTYIYSGLLKHHYTEKAGKVDFGIEQIIYNALDSLGRLQDIYGNFGETTFFIFMLGIVLLILVSIICFKSNQNIVYKNNSKLLILGINALIISTLTFAPASVTTNLLDRYLVAPITLGLISVVAFVIYLHPKNTTTSYWKNLIGLTALLFIISANAIRTKEILHNKYKTQLDTHYAVRKLVNNELPKWSKNAQIVILLAGDGETSTMGYNHWSTWYLRYLTGNLNTIGLLGKLSENYPLIKYFPFIKQYKDDGPEFWKIMNGRSYHAQMVGLEISRPLFAYQQNKAGEFKPIEYILFSSEEGVNLVQFGQSYQEAKEQPLQLQQLCKQPSNVFMWPTTQISDYKSPVNFTQKSNLLNSEKLVFDGTNSVSMQINIPKHQYFRLEFSLTNTSEINSVIFNEISPPMPMLTPALALYQYPSSKMHFVKRQDSESYVVNETNSNQTNVFFEGISDCIVLFGFNKKLRGILTKQSLNGNWLLGKGYKDRYWKGELSNMTIKTTK